MSSPCSNCGEPVQTRRRLPAGCRISCADTECLRAVAASHNADVTAYEAKMAARPKVPRTRRTTQPLYGDLRWIASINGITTDGTGRRANG